jgi:hypothetical protein
VNRFVACAKVRGLGLFGFALRQEKASESLLSKATKGNTSKF